MIAAGSSEISTRKIQRLKYDLKVVPILHLNKETLDQLAPLDLISFQAGDLVSKLIALATIWDSGNSDFSHSGMVVDEELMPWLAPVLKGRKAIWESTNSKTFGGIVDSGTKDLVTGKGKLGSQIRLLEDVVIDYLIKDDSDAELLRQGKTLERKQIKKNSSYICWSKLRQNPWRRLPTDTDASFQKRRGDITHQIALIYKKLGDSEYEINLAMLGSSVVPILKPAGELIHHLSGVLGNNDKRNDTVNESAGETGADLQFEFCSELVFRVWQLLDLAPPHISASKITPVEFYGSKSQKMDMLVESISYLIPPGVPKSDFRHRIWNKKGKPTPEERSKIEAMDAN